jgi:hypothetical protein
MTTKTIEQQRRKKGAKLIQSIQSYAGELLDGATVSVMSPFLLHYGVTFTIKGDVGSGDLLIHYDWEMQNLVFQVRLSEIIPREHIERAVTFINLINIECSCVHYTILQESGEVGLSFNMFVGKDLPSRHKIRKAIILLINDATIASLLLHWLITQDLSPQELHEFYLNFQSNTYPQYPDSSKMTKSCKDRTLNAIVNHFRKAAGCRPLNEDYLEDGFLLFDLYITEDLNGRMIIDIDEILETISFRLTPMAVVPEERTMDLMKLLPSLNYSSGINHFILDPVDRWVVLKNGILLDDGVLHRQELNKIVGIMLGSGFLYFPLIAEFARSDITPEEVFARLKTKMLSKVDIRYRHNMFKECR